MKTLLLLVILAPLAGYASETKTPPQKEVSGAIAPPQEKAVNSAVPDRPPLAVAAPMPAFPAEAEAKNLTGEVQAEMKIDSDGAVSDIKIVSSTDESFANAVKEALGKWRFMPAVQGGQTVGQLLTVRFFFGGSTGIQVNCLVSDEAENAIRIASWLQRSAGEGDVRAQAAVGWIYERGIGVPQDLTMAAK